MVLRGRFNLNARIAEGIVPPSSIPIIRFGEYFFILFRGMRERTCAKLTFLGFMGIYLREISGMRVGASFEAMYAQTMFAISRATITFWSIGIGRWTKYRSVNIRYGSWIAKARSAALNAPVLLIR